MRKGRYLCFYATTLFRKYQSSNVAQGPIVIRQERNLLEKCSKILAMLDNQIIEDGDCLFGAFSTYARKQIYEDLAQNRAQVRHVEAAHESEPHGASLGM